MMLLPADDPSLAHVQADLELVAIETDLGSGQYDRAIARCTSILPSLRRVDELERWRLLRALSFAAYGNFVMGRRDASLSCLSELLAELWHIDVAPLQE